MDKDKFGFLFSVRRFFGPCFWGIRDTFGSVLSLDDIVRCPGWLITTADTLHAIERSPCPVCGRVWALSFCASFGCVFWVFRLFRAAVFRVFSVGFGWFFVGPLSLR